MEQGAGTASLGCLGAAQLPRRTPGAVLMNHLLAAAEAEALAVTGLHLNRPFPAENPQSLWAGFKKHRGA